MEQMNNSNEILNMCGRCGMSFPNGGPGVPFCPACINEVNRENGVVQQQKTYDNTTSTS